LGTLNAASGHHIREGRWLHDSAYMNSYLNYFFRDYGWGRGGQVTTSTTLKSDCPVTFATRHDGAAQPRVYTSWQVLRSVPSQRPCTTGDCRATQMHAAWHKFLVDGDWKILAELLPAFDHNVKGWVREHRTDRCKGVCARESAGPRRRRRRKRRRGSQRTCASAATMRRRTAGSRSALTFRRCAFPLKTAGTVCVCVCVRCLAAEACDAKV
jgi:hypothetical protein